MEQQRTTYFDEFDVFDGPDAESAVQPTEVLVVSLAKRFSKVAILRYMERTDVVSAHIVLSNREAEKDEVVWYGHC